MGWPFKLLLFSFLLRHVALRHFGLTEPKRGIKLVFIVSQVPFYGWT
jgi:hypothetical protein